MKMTEKAIERLKTPEQTREIGDESTTGLYLRVTPAGRKIWRYRYRLRGRTRIMTLGEWPGVSLTEARTASYQARAEVVKGNDPAGQAQHAASQRRQMPTVAEFVPEYIKRYAKPHKKSWKQDKQILERWIVPNVGKLRMDEVSRRDIVAIIDQVRDSGATRQPGKVLAAARMLFKIAIQRGILESTPCTYISEPQSAPTQRAMTADQIRTWWQETGKALEADQPAIHKPTALALRVLLLTGQRPGEIAEMTRDELHLKSPFGPHWIISGDRRKKGRAKTGKSHAVALGSEAVTAIRAARAMSRSEYVFEKPSGGPIRTDSHLSVSLGRIFGQPPRPTPHSARHTVATELAELGIDEYHVGRVLGHGSKTVTGTVYINNRINEAALRSQRTLIAAWQKRLFEIVGGALTADNVVELAEPR